MKTKNIGECECCRKERPLTKALGGNYCDACLEYADSMMDDENYDGPEILECPACRGSGKYDDATPCPECDGDGVLP